MSNKKKPELETNHTEYGNPDEALVQEDHTEFGETIRKPSQTVTVVLPGGGTSIANSSDKLNSTNELQ